MSYIFSIQRFQFIIKKIKNRYFLFKFVYGKKKHILKNVKVWLRYSKTDNKPVYIEMNHTKTD